MSPLLRNQDYDRANRAAVREGRNLPVEMWVRPMLRGDLLVWYFSRSYSKSQHTSGSRTRGQFLIHSICWIGCWMFGPPPSKSFSWQSPSHITKIYSTSGTGGGERSRSFSGSFSRTRSRSASKPSPWNKRHRMRPPTQQIRLDF